MPSEIEFKGEMHTIPAGASLVLKADRILSTAQTEAVRSHCARVLGHDRILVIGPEFEISAVQQAPAQGEVVARNLTRLMRFGWSG